MRASKQKANEQHQSAPTTLEQIQQRAHEIYVAHGGAEGMALNDWLMAEQELKRKLEG